MNLFGDLFLLSIDLNIRSHLYYKNINCIKNRDLTLRIGIVFANANEEKVKKPDISLMIV